MPATKEQQAAGWLSVSQVLDGYQEEGIIDWKIKVGKKEAKRIGTIALKIGTRIHELIEQDWKEGKYKFKTTDPIEVRNCMAAWEQFKTDYRPEILNMETEIKDEVNKIVGHRDALIKLNDSLVVLDFKTSAQINRKHWVQVNKYAEMDMFLDQVGVLRLDKNLGIYEYQQQPYSEGLVNVFDCMLVAHRYFNPNGESQGEDANGTTDDSSTDRGF